MRTEYGYRQLFQDYIVAGVDSALAHVQADGDTLSDTERQQAWQVLSYALAVDEAWPRVARLLLALAPKMARGGYWTEWIPYLEEGLVRSREQGDEATEAEIALQLGHLRHRLSQLEEAEQCVRRAVQLFTKQQNLPRQCAALNRQAEICRAIQEFDEAERLANKSLALSAVESMAPQDERGHSYLIKGRIAFDRQDWSGAGSHFERALHLYDAAGNGSRSAVCIQNLGRVRLMETQFDEAEVCFQRAIQMLKETNDRFNLAVVQMNLGIVHSLCDRPLDALKEYAKAEPVFRRLHTQAYLAKVYNNQGMEMNNLKRWSEAESLLTMSAAICLELDDLQGYINVQDSLGLTSMGQGNYLNAIRIFDNALAVSQDRSGQHFMASTLAELAVHRQQAATLRTAEPYDGDSAAPV